MAVNSNYSPVYVAFNEVQTDEVQDGIQDTLNRPNKSLQEMISAAFNWFDVLQWYESCVNLIQRIRCFSHSLYRTYVVKPSQANPEVDGQVYYVSITASQNEYDNESALRDPDMQETNDSSRSNATPDEGQVVCETEMTSATSSDRQLSPETTMTPESRKSVTSTSRKSCLRPSAATIPENLLILRRPKRK